MTIVFTSEMKRQGVKVKLWIDYKMFHLKSSVKGWCREGLKRRITNVSCLWLHNSSPDGGGLLAFGQ